MSISFQNNALNYSNLYTHYDRWFGNIFSHFFTGYMKNKKIHHFVFSGNRWGLQYLTIAYVMNRKKRKFVQTNLFPFTRALPIKKIKINKSLFFLLVCFIYRCNSVHQQRLGRNNNNCYDSKHNNNNNKYENNDHEERGQQAFTFTHVYNIARGRQRKCTVCTLFGTYITIIIHIDTYLYICAC